MTNTIKFFNADNTLSSETNLGMIATQDIASKNKKVAKHFKAGGSASIKTSMGQVTITTVEELQALCDNLITKNIQRITFFDKAPTKTMGEVYSLISSAYETNLSESTKEAAYTVNAIMNKNLGECTDEAWVCPVTKDNANKSLAALNEHIASLEYLESLIHASITSEEHLAVTDDDNIKIAHAILKRAEGLYHD